MVILGLASSDVPSDKVKTLLRKMQKAEGDKSTVKIKTVERM